MRRAERAKQLFLLAGPHTWSASVIPSLLPLALAAGRGSGLAPGFAVMAAAVLLQSAANALNDYADFIKGTDTAENSPEAYDAVVVNGLPPKCALAAGLAFMAAAALPGAYAVSRAGAPVLAAGAVGAMAVLAYSLGRRPLSYLPLGELVSGLVMGVLIPFAGASAQLGLADLSMLARTPPLALGVALIMFSNNLCDLERDAAAGRRTFPLMLGARRAAKLYRALLALWPASQAALLLALDGPRAAALFAAAFIPAAPLMARQLAAAPGPDTRPAMMGGINALNALLGLACCLAAATGGA